MSGEILLARSGDIATVGITDHAQAELTDIVFVELPTVGRKVKAGEACAVVESVKTASDIYSPVSGGVKRYISEKRLHVVGHTRDEHHLIIPGSDTSPTIISPLTDGMSAATRARRTASALATAGLAPSAR